MEAAVQANEDEEMPESSDDQELLPTFKLADFELLLPMIGQLTTEGKSIFERMKPKQPLQLSKQPSNSDQLDVNQHIQEIEAPEQQVLEQSIPVD